MPEILPWLQKEWGVIARAPWTFATGGVLVAGAVWLAASAYYREEVASARQQADTAEANVKLWRDKYDELKGNGGVERAGPAAPQEKPPLAPTGQAMLVDAPPAQSKAADAAVATIPPAAPPPKRSATPAISTPKPHVSAKDGGSVMGNYGLPPGADVSAEGPKSRVEWNIFCSKDGCKPGEIPGYIRGRQPPSSPSEATPSQAPK